MAEAATVTALTLEGAAAEASCDAAMPKLFN
jgi:hypothetical protein